MTLLGSEVIYNAELKPFYIDAQTYIHRTPKLLTHSAMRKCSHIYYSALSVSCWWELKLQTAALT